MASVTITNKKCELNGNAKIDLTALSSATDGAIITPVSSRKTLIIVKNVHASAAKTVTIKKGNGLQGVADLTKSIPFGETHVFMVESGAYQNISGSNRGKIVVVGESTDIQVACIELP